GLLLARALRKRRRARLDDIDEQALRAEHDEYLRESDPQRFDLELEVERMEGEGGDPAAAEAPVDERGRRFGRSAARSNGASVR
ncbi:MAG: hypothetical protein KDC46_16455, partial [Thermoleophilia bacterium]|nr:hypothetical protein [Thermoleophilia bacterium]